MRNKTMTTLAAFAATAVFASACGSGGAIGSSAPDNTEVEVTTVENPLPDDSEGDATDSEPETGDDTDDAPAPSGDGHATADFLAPLDAQNSSGEITALVESLLGPTEDISGELSQLYPFPRVPTQSGAHIMEVAARTTFVDTDEAGTARVTTSTIVKVDGDRADIIGQYEAAFDSMGWNLDKTEEKNDISTGDPSTVLSFSKNGQDRGFEIMGVTVVSDTELGANQVRLRYSASDFLDADGALTNRFVGWHGQVPLHEGAERSAIQVDSTFGPGRTEIEIVTSYKVESFPTEDRDELIQLLVDKAAAEGLDATEVPSGITVERDNLDRLFISAGDGHAVRGEIKVLTPPFDGAKVIGEEKSDEPLPASDATADEIAAIVTDILGPTADVSSQMQRLGLFPDVPTPNGADIVNVRSGIENVISFGGNSDDFRAANSEVEMFIDGDYDDVNAFYDAQLAALGWTVDSNKTEKTDDGLSTVRRVGYEISQEPGEQITADLTVTDDVDDARTKVQLSYTEIVSKEDSGIERWQGWFGDSPFPDGGEVHSGGIGTSAIGSAAVFYRVEYRYPGKDLAEMIGQIESSFGGSTFAVADGEKLEAGENTKLVHPDFSNPNVWLWDSFKDGGRIELKAARRLE